MTNPQYDAILLVSFGGPERPEDVMPFLRRVTRGKNVPEERLLKVAEHYYHLGGRSPINEQCRALKQALESELAQRGWRLPVYWGNRNWHPLLADTMRQMAADGVRRALAVVTSLFGSYSSCRRYLEDLEEARQECGNEAPQVDRVRLGFNHPGFIAAMADRVRVAIQPLKEITSDQPRLMFTAHSIPVSMAKGAPYVAQLMESSRLVAERVGINDWQLAYQSRSGPPHVPWLEPDVLDVLQSLAQRGDRRPVVLVPIGFVSDHVEVLYDLDVEARELAQELGIPFCRAETVGTHPAFVQGLCDMIEERLRALPTRLAVGQLPPCPDACPPDCCLTR